MRNGRRGEAQEARWKFPNRKGVSVTLREQRTGLAKEQPGEPGCGARRPCLCALGTPATCSYFMTNAPRPPWVLPLPLSPAYELKMTKEKHTSVAGLSPGKREASVGIALHGSFPLPLTRPQDKCSASDPQQRLATRAWQLGRCSSPCHQTERKGVPCGRLMSHQQKRDMSSCQWVTVSVPRLGGAAVPGGRALCRGGSELSRCLHAAVLQPKPCCGAQGPLKVLPSRLPGLSLQRGGEDELPATSGFTAALRRAWRGPQTVPSLHLTASPTARPPWSWPSHPGASSELAGSHALP